MKDTLQNKKRLIAQYWGQKILMFKSIISDSFYDYPINSNYIDCVTKELGYLKLKLLSEITENDLSNIGFGNIGEKKVTIYPNSSERQWFSSCGNMGYLMLDHFDYLRSKGYALPYNGITVDEQIEYGWIKINK